ncbi:MAG: hypothetical protein NC114_06370 [Ruminococcus flavefaciens]|nr:hypothetical protein [Ruminococcus flavefaciens]
MFDRAYDKPLVEYIVDTCRNLEVIPAITLESWELVTDQLKIRSEVNKNNSKDPKIKNNKSLERLAQPNKTLYDMLYLTFRVQAKDRDATVVRKVRVPKPVHGGYYIRNGKKVRVLNQVVDNSTFVKKNVLNFKTKLYPIKLSTVRMKLKFIDGETATCPCFRLDLLYKVTNPLIYYLAQYGVQHTIEMFRLEDVMSVVDAPLDEDNYMYLPINDGIYLEVNEKAFYGHEFVGAFTATLYDVLREDHNITFSDVYDQEYWYGRLSEIFSKKRYANKALRILISFNKIMDTSVKKQLVIGKRRKRNTFTIILWMMTNYGELIKKDSHDLRYKRVRANETLAYYFDKHISKNVYSLLNTDNPPFEKYIRLLNSINEYTLLRGASGGGKGSTTSMFRYERYNDFDAIEISRYTLKGPTGINGGKERTSLTYRDIYPSHLGRLDMNVCSSSDPGLTGYLCANVKLDETGYFDTKNSEPDSYDMAIDAVVSKFAEPGYRHSRDEYIDTQQNRDEDGFVILKRRPTSQEMHRMMVERPEEFGLYRTDDGLKLIPKSDNIDSKGFKILARRKPGKDADKVVRDTAGFIVLTRVVTKMSVRDQESS